MIRIYRHDWSPEQRAKLRVADLVESVEPARKPGAPEGNQNAVKGEGNKRANGEFDSGDKPKRKPGKNNHSPERVIARLKRDKETDSKAADLLSQIETGGIKPYRAAVEMAWIKEPTPVEKALKLYRGFSTEEQALFWRMATQLE